MREGEGEAWTAAAAPGFELPDSLQALLTARVDRLDEDTRRTLQIASVIGRAFSRSALAALVEQPDSLDNHLLELQRMELVREVARAADPVRDNAPAAYGIYMFDPGKKTWLVVASPPEGFMYTDPIALQVRPEPNVVEPTTVDAALAAQDMALIEVRSVYDTDGLQRMAEPMFVAADRPADSARFRPAGSVLTTAPEFSEAPRRGLWQPSQVRRSPGRTWIQLVCVWMARPSLSMMDSASGTSAGTLSLKLPSGSMGLRQAIGETDFEQQQILGYAPIEPEGGGTARMARTKRAGAHR